MQQLRQEAVKLLPQQEQALLSPFSSFLWLHQVRTSSALP